MSDDLKRRPQDAMRINVSEPWALRYWSNELRVTEQQLRDTVKQVGTSAAAVRKHLGR